MKKILYILLAISLMQTNVFADEIIDAQGQITKCKIETVESGFIEYKKNGNLYSFERASSSDIFNDYVDVKETLFKRNPIIKRVSGTVIIKDMWSVIIKTSDFDNSKIDIPFYRIKNVGIYKP